MKSRLLSGGLLVVLCSLGAVGCMADRVRSAFANEFSCDNDGVTVDEIGANRWIVTGCGHTVSYACIGTTCIPNGERDDSAKVESGGRAEQSTSTAPPPTAGENGSAMGVAHLAKNKAGASLVALDLRLDKKTLLKLRAQPEAKKGVLFQVVYLKDEDADTDCQIAAMINGQRVELPKTRDTEVTGQGNYGRTLTALQTELSPSLVKELAVARQFAVKACDSRWPVTAEGVQELRHFAELFEQEQAWEGPAAQGGSGGLMAPASGWPDWAPSGTPPAASKGAALDPPALFKVLSPSVFKVIAVSSDGTKQGSAVAVSQNELVTNCHVVEGAQKITLKQGKAERAVELARANPAADRCVLSVAEKNLTPVRGVRAYGDLEVGEALYTLGSPSGLELSLSNGILSGKRDEDGLSYVQTTAPISPGSSGGGLFDARGNLVGVTTLVLTGREKLNQSLNFAIPADAFWQK